MMLRPRTTWESLTDPASPARRGGKKHGNRSYVHSRARTRPSHLHQLGCPLGRNGARRLLRMERVPTKGGNPSGNSEWL
jgi:hypothetical protein